VEVTRLQSGPTIDIDRVRFLSKELNEPRFFLALKPHRMETPRDVWVLNHGWADRPEDLLTELGVERVYSELLASEKVIPALVILPDVRFSNFYRVHSERFPFAQYLVLVGEEVAGLVERHYEIPRSREHWSIGGFSFGGYVSLDIGRRYMGRFGSVSVISSFFDRDWAFWPEVEPPAGRLDARGRGKQTVVVPGPRPRLMLACGASDRFFGQMVELHDELTGLGIPHEWSQAPGGHAWEYWRSVLPAMFTFHLGRENQPGGAK
jgi:enterochelin esterase-like enzyme